MNMLARIQTVLLKPKGKAAQTTACAANEVPKKPESDVTNSNNSSAPVSAGGSNATQVAQAPVLASMPSVSAESAPAKTQQPVIHLEEQVPKAVSSELPAIVKFHQVTKRFGHGASAQVALQDISFTVEDLPSVGELIAVVGPSGCGKSTLLRMIAGLQPHFPQTSGEIEVLGSKTNLLPSEKRGLVDQKYSLFPHLTVMQNVTFGLSLL